MWQINENVQSFEEQPPNQEQLHSTGKQEQERWSGSNSENSWSGESQAIGHWLGAALGEQQIANVESEDQQIALGLERILNRLQQLGELMRDTLTRSHGPLRRSKGCEFYGDRYQVQTQTILYPRLVALRVEERALEAEEPLPVINTEISGTGQLSVYSISLRTSRQDCSMCSVWFETTALCLPGRMTIIWKEVGSASSWVLPGITKLKIWGVVYGVF